MVLRDFIAPFDPVIGAQYDDTIGQRLSRLTPAPHSIGELPMLACRVSFEPVKQRKYLVPHATRGGHLTGLRMGKPGYEGLDMRQVVCQQPEERDAEQRPACCRTKYEPRDCGNRGNRSELPGRSQQEIVQ